jgi:membrane protein DedA with SNARE-associated domain
MNEIMHIFINELTKLIESNGYLAVTILMTAESALIPIPSEVTMPFAGFMSGLGTLNFWTVVFLGALGNLIGSLMAYYLGYYKGEEWILYSIRKWGKYLLIREEEYFKSKEWFIKYGQGITFVSRLLPVVRTFISLPAGIARMEIIPFSILTFLGSLIWSLFLAWLGLKLGQNWQIIEPYFRQFQILIVGIFLVFAFWYVARHFRLVKEDAEKRKKKE